MTPKQLKDTPLPSLKRIALEELNLTKDQVREYGHLSYRATWIDAIRLTARSANANARVHNQANEILAIANQAPKNVEKNHFSASSKHRIANDNHIAIELGWASSLSAPHICNDIAEIVSPLRVILLSATHKRFKAWQPWMDIDRQFTFFNGSRHTIRAPTLNW